MAKQAAESLVKTNIAPVLSARQLAAELTRQDEVKSNTKQLYLEKGLAAFNGLPAKSQTRAEAKLLILKAYKAY